MVFFTNNALCQSWKRADRKKKKREKKEWHVNNWGKKTHSLTNNNNSKWKSFAGRRELCKERKAGKVKPQQQVICGPWWKEGVTVFLSGKPYTSSSSLFQNPSAGREIIQQAHAFVLYALEHPYSLRNGAILMTNTYGSCWCRTYLLPHPRGTGDLWPSCHSLRSPRCFRPRPEASSPVSTK